VGLRSADACDAPGILKASSPAGVRYVNEANGRRSARRRVFSAAFLAALAVAAAIVLLVTAGRSPHRRVAPTATAKPAFVHPPAQPEPTPEEFGANVNRVFDDQFSGHGYTARQIDAQLEALRATGATVARSDTLWEATEPEPPQGGVHRYDWAFDDSIAGSLALHGLRWLPVIDYSAPWAKSTPNELHSPPVSASEYATYATAFAARYGRGGAFWRERPKLKAEPVETYEVWNEPDNATFWSPAPDAARYADLYVQARDAIDAVDPTARVVVGGLTKPASFLPAMLRARPDLAGHVDGVAIHPYGANPSVVLGRVRGAHSVLASLGLTTVPLYVTEFGWTTHPVGALSWAPEGLRPGYISSTIAALGQPGCGVAATLLYTWVTPQRDLGNPGDWYGIYPPSGGMTPDTRAFAAGLRAAITSAGSGCRSPSAVA
jgi:hypothetical protein